jgi:hypothetical protein
MTRSVWSGVKLAACAMILATPIGASYAVTRSAAELEPVPGAASAAGAAPPTIAFKPEIKLLPDNPVGLVIETHRARPGKDGSTYRFKLRLGGVDLEFGADAAR